MGPELMMGMAALGAVGTGVQAYSQIQGANAQADAMREQAAADQARAVQNQQIANAKAIEERANAQKMASEEIRTTRLAQSKLGAVAGASGSGASDPTVMQLYGQIEKEGQKNAAYDTAAGNQRAQGITYQAALDRWTADANSSIKRSAASQTALGGALSGIGTGLTGLSSMALKYGGNRTAVGGRTGY